MNDELETQNKSTRSSSERLNFIIAVCAILISGASFYATYLQADAANKQVKAMTLPMIQYSHGNAYGDDKKTLKFSLKNAGIGPALLRSVEFTYQDNSFSGIFKVLTDCCSPMVSKFYSKEKQDAGELPGIITSPLINSIVPGQDELVFLRFKYVEDTSELWEVLNDIRFDIGFQACYCSMLDECYTVNEKAVSQAVKACQ